MKHLPFLLFLAIIFALASCDYQGRKIKTLERRLERVTEDRNWWRNQAEKMVDTWRP